MQPRYNAFEMKQYFFTIYDIEWPVGENTENLPDKIELQFDRDPSTETMYDRIVEVCGGVEPDYYKVRFDGTAGRDE